MSDEVADKVELLVDTLITPGEPPEKWSPAAHLVRVYLARKLDLELEKVRRRHVFQFVAKMPDAFLKKYIRGMGTKSVEKLRQEAKEFA